MPTAPSQDAFFLNAIVVEDHSPQSRTNTLSRVRLASLLTKQIAAISVCSRKKIHSDWLWDAMIDKPELFASFLKAPHHARRWMLFSKDIHHRGFEYKSIVEDIDKYAGKPEELLTLGNLDSKGSDLDVITLVPCTEWKQPDARKILEYLDAALSRQPIILLSHYASDDADDTSDREALIRVRRAMLEKVGSYSSEDLAAAAASTTSNASQFAADQRSLGKFFGVRFGQAWHYPRFQFDTRRQPIPEMKQVLAALSPDEQGWDRLQWFLEPHEKLKGRTPIEEWKSDRNKVIEAANMERWNGRD